MLDVAAMPGTPAMGAVAALGWPIAERLHLGPLAISPHGISIALGFLLGASLLARRAALRGVARRRVANIPEQMSSLALRAGVGAIVGARFFYVVTRLEQFPTVLSWFTVWRGGISLLGGIAGAVLAGIPFALRRDYSIRLLLDSVAPGLALGIFIGRIGDLVIGEHLGGQTDFALGWRCTGALGDPGAPYPFTGPEAQGCFDVAVHQTALYDFLAAGLVLGALLLLERRPRFDGFFLVVFTVLYGAGRFVTDFAREADIDMVGTLTGSQLTVLAAIAAALGWVVVARPDRLRPWAWSPPDFAHPWDQEEAAGTPAGEDAPTTAETGRSGAEG